MRKKAILISIFSVFLFAIIITAVVLFSPCKHRWINANCTVAKTCSKCGEVEGEALGHNWSDATCKNPKTCSRCKATEGKALTHNWGEADCENPKTCSICKETTGKALGHNWNDATCKSPKTCSICNATEGETGNHNWKKATCRSPKKCTVCGKTEGSASKHYYIVNNDFGGYRFCAYCNEYEPNVHCSDCGWSMFTTGVGAEGITCPDCGNKVI